MADSSSECPPGTQKFVSGSAIACGIQEPSNPTCVSLNYSIPQNYSEVCGQMAGYQKGSLDAFAAGINDINSNYVDGVSITRGSPRQHVWTYTAGYQSDYNNGNYPEFYICPCSPYGTQQVPSFVGSDYYCESGCPSDCIHTAIFANNVLWDGEQCGNLLTSCCTNPDLPWFHKVFDKPCLHDIEIRLCIDQNTSDENILVSLYDIYVK